MRQVEFNGYVGAAHFDAIAKMYHGEVLNLRDVVTFQAGSEAELPQAFQASVEDYLEFCQSRAELPELPPGQG